MAPAPVDRREGHPRGHRATIQGDCYYRQRIAKLEQSEQQPIQKDRGEILRALLAANGGKMLAKEARQKMRLSKSRFSELLDSR
jgi:hypothetical protein